MLDAAVLAWFQAHRDPVLTACMLAVSHVHSTPGLLALTLLPVALAWRRGERAWSATFVVAVGGAMLVNVALKHLVQRPRPVLADPVVVYETYSFPSGHATGSAAFYAVLAAWLLARLRDRPAWQRAAVVAAAALLAALASLARLVLGVHYLTDVLAGMALGASFALAAVHLLRRPARRGRAAPTSTLIPA